VLRLPRYFEYAYACFALCFFMANPINVLTLGAGGGQLIEDAESNFLLPGLSMALYMVAFVILAINWRMVIDRFLSNPQFLLLMLFIAIIIASRQWSAYPTYTMRRGILIAGATAFALFFSMRFRFIAQLKILAVAMSAATILCLLFGLFLPTYGVMSLPPHVGAWRGTHIHKNDLGPQMALIAIFLWTVRSARVFKSLGNLMLVFVIVCAIFLTVASKSTTAQLSLVAMGLIFVVCNLLRLNYRLMVSAISSIMLIAGATAVYLQSNIGQFLGYFGKGSDLSGRDALWPPIMEMVSRRPLLGYGYEGFWRGDGSPASIVWKSTGWPTPHAHNGFLDILLAIGWVGGIIFLLSFFLTLTTSFKLLRLSKLTYAICPIIVLVFIVLSNTTESNLFTSDAWILYMWACFFPWALANELDDETEEDEIDQRLPDFAVSAPSAY